MNLEDIKPLLDLSDSEFKEALSEMVATEEKADIEHQISVCNDSIENLNKSIENTKEALEGDDCTKPMKNQGEMNLEVFSLQISQYEKLKIELEKELQVH